MKFINDSKLKCFDGHLFVEEFKHKRKYLQGGQDTENILLSCLYDIEYLYLVNKLGSFDFIIYDLLYLEDNRKICFCRLNNSKDVQKIVIPNLMYSYGVNKFYEIYNVYVWKTKKNEIKKKYSLNKMYNFHENRLYRVGDINSYGHVLIKIDRVEYLYKTKKFIKEVGLYI